jgi:hypothetical protein
MPDLQDLFDRSARAAGAGVYWTTRTARLMIGVPVTKHMSRIGEPTIRTSRS